LIEVTICDLKRNVSNFVPHIDSDEGKMRGFGVSYDEGKMRGLRADTKRDVACFDD
jgi:hypothetical protein